MKTLLCLPLILLILTSCTGRTQEDCDKIAEEIRTLAKKRGVPSEGACNNPLLPEADDECTDLRKCQEEVN